MKIIKIINIINNNNYFKIKKLIKNLFKYYKKIFIIKLNMETWDFEKAEKLNSENSFFTTLYTKPIQISKAEFYWRKKPEILFVDSLESKKVRIADTLENICRLINNEKYFSDIFNIKELVLKNSISLKNSGYKFYNNKLGKFNIGDLRNYSMANKYKELCLQEIESNKIKIENDFIKNIDDVLLIEQFLPFIQKIPNTKIKNAKIEKNFIPPIKEKLSEAFKKNLFLDVTNYKPRSNLIDLISLNDIEKLGLIYSERLKLASNNFENFETAYKEAFKVEDRQSDEMIEEITNMKILFEENNQMFYKKQKSVKNIIEVNDKNLETLNEKPVSKKNNTENISKKSVTKSLQKKFLKKDEDKKKDETMEIDFHIEESTNNTVYLNSNEENRDNIIKINENLKKNVKKRNNTIKKNIKK